MFNSNVIFWGGTKKLLICIFMNIYNVNFWLTIDNYTIVFKLMVIWTFCYSFDKNIVN
jgi:hypothetical protein